MNTEIDYLLDKLTESKKNRNYEKGIEYIDEILEIDPDFTIINYDKSLCHFALENYDETIECAEICLENDLNNEMKKRMHFVTGISYYKKEEYENALEYFDKSLKIDSNDEHTIYYKSSALLELERYDEALTLAEKIANNELEAEILTKKGDYETAIKIYDELIESSQDFTDIIDFKEMKAKALFQNENYEEFLNIAEEIVSISPNQSFYLFMSIAYNKIGNFENAAKYFELSTSFYPKLRSELLGFAEENKDFIYDENSVEDNLKMGIGYLDDNQFEMALKYFKKADELKENDEKILIFLSETYFKLFDFENEYKCLKKIIEINPENYDMMFELANVCSDLEKSIEVIDLGNRLLGIDSKYDPVYALISKAYLELEDNQNAFDCIDEAINLYPNSNYFMDYKGLLYLMLDDEDNAQICFNKALEIMPEDPLPYLTQIRFYKEHRNAEKEEEVYEKLILKFPEFRRIR